MMLAFVIVLFLAERGLCVYNEGPRHGGDGGSLHNFSCPSEGAITELTYREGHEVDAIGFVCTAPLGTKTSFGPYGGNGGGFGSLACPTGYYVSSFYGKSGWRLDKLGIRCRKQGDLTSKGQSIGEIGGHADGGGDFDDLPHSYGARPISVTIRSGSRIDSIQITYADTAVKFN